MKTRGVRKIASRKAVKPLKDVARIMGVRARPLGKLPAGAELVTYGIPMVADSVEQMHEAITGHRIAQEQG